MTYGRPHRGAEGAQPALDEALAQLSAVRAELAAAHTRAAHIYGDHARIVNAVLACAADVAVLVTDAACMVLQASPGALHLLGEDVTGSRLTLWGEDHVGAPVSGHLVHGHDSLGPREIEITVTEAAVVEGEASAFVVAVNDVTEAVRTEAALQYERDLSTAVIESAGALVVVTTRAGRVVRFNRSAEALSGHPSNQVLGHLVWDRLLPDDERDAAAADYAAMIAGEIASSNEGWVFDVHGERHRVAWSNTILRDTAGAVEFVVAVGVDVTEARRAEARLRLLAETDPLTGLLNRTSFESALNAALEPATGMGCGLLFCDLDGFKAINDNYGHAVGDSLLIGVADRLKALVRDSDVVARLGGDEFVVLCSGAGRPEVKALATRLETAVRRPFELDGVNTRVGVSVGTTVGFAGDDPAVVLRTADVQMYAVKSARHARHALAAAAAAAEEAATASAAAGIPRIADPRENDGMLARTRIA